MDYLNIATHWTMWLAGAPLAIITIVIPVIYIRLAKKASTDVGLSAAEAKKAIRVGMTASIGPAVGVLVVMLGLMASFGSPYAWTQSVSIGSAPIVLSAANLTAGRMGSALGSESFTALHFAAVAWVLALNGMSWLLFTGFFADKLAVIQRKVSGGHPENIAILSGGAMIGAFAYFFVGEFNTGIELQDSGYIAALLSSGITMYLLTLIGAKFPKIKEYNLGISMLAGMAIGVLWKTIL